MSPPGCTDGMPPLSQSLPLSGAFAAGGRGAFFGGLLPEGAPRSCSARRLGVSASNDFGLLAALGGDTAGAISLHRRRRAARAAADDVEWLDDDALVPLIDELPTRPMHADEDGEYRLSLAGVQDKLPVVVGADGRIGLTKGRTPSTHILKTPIARLEHTVVNEAFCLAIGRALGVDAVTATPRRVGDREFLLVERYDRRSRTARSAGCTRRTSARRSASRPRASTRLRAARRWPTASRSCARRRGCPRGRSSRCSTTSRSASSSATTTRTARTTPCSTCRMRRARCWRPPTTSSARSPTTGRTTCRARWR